MALIETIIALALVYALLSVVATAVKEMLEAAVQLRKGSLRTTVEDLLGAVGAGQFLKDPRIRAICAIAGNIDPRQSRHWPSYIDACTFAAVAKDVIAQYPDSTLAQAIKVTEDAAGNELAAVTRLYEERMTRLTGSFKRNAQWWLLGIGLGLAVLTDADTLRLGRDMATDSAVRAAVISQLGGSDGVQKAADKCKAVTVPSLQQDLATCLHAVAPAALGWSDWRKRELRHDFSAALAALIGYLLTAVAVSMGAPFWFDLISKVSNVRATFKPTKA